MKWPIYAKMVIEIRFNGFNGLNGITWRNFPVSLSVRKCLQITYASLLQNLQILSD